MKKIILLGATIMCGLGAFAQANVLKDAERAMKAKEPMKKVVQESALQLSKFRLHSSQRLRQLSGHIQFRNIAQSAKLISLHGKFAVRSQEDNHCHRQVRPNMFGKLQAIHLRHLDIDKEQLKAAPAIYRSREIIAIRKF